MGERSETLDPRRGPACRLYGHPHAVLGLRDGHTVRPVLDLGSQQSLWVVNAARESCQLTISVSTILPSTVRKVWGSPVGARSSPVLSW